MSDPEDVCKTLRSKNCVPCEGGVPKLSADEAHRLAQALAGWVVSPNAGRISKTWTARNFLAALKFFDQVGQLAEAEGHHPDLHLERYRNIRIEIWTHAIGGLSENDFILAAKIDQIPLELKK